MSRRAFWYECYTSSEKSTASVMVPTMFVRYHDNTGLRDLMTSQLRPWEPAPNSNWTSQNPPTVLYPHTCVSGYHKAWQAKEKKIYFMKFTGYTSKKNSWYVFDVSYVCVSYKQQHRDVSVDIRTTAVRFTHTHIHKHTHTHTHTGTV